MVNYFAIGLPIALAVRLFAGVPLFWITVALVVISTIIGISKMDTTKPIAARKYKEGKSYNAHAMSQAYIAARKKQKTENANYAFYLQQKYPWKRDIKEKKVETLVWCKDGSRIWCDYVTWNERLQELHLHYSFTDKYEVVPYDSIGSIQVS